MKKHFTWLIALGLLAGGAGAQTSMPLDPAFERFLRESMVKVTDQVGDFTITDSEGVTWNLYQSLDQGKTVFLDLFFTTCSYCQLYAPIIEQIYQNTGAGQGNVLMWGLSPQDNNTQINNYKTQYGITNPCAGNQGGGPAAINIVKEGQVFLGYPTYCIVCPDRTLYFDICYPPSVACFNPYFSNCEQTVCIAGFSADQTEICQEEGVHFLDESVGNITS
ncbi:MAG: redoxin domain-containing protein [Bacteroidales bacterium]|nr:redoxin domain-containing protein [Bacteroidales bacterium]